MTLDNEVVRELASANTMPETRLRVVIADADPLTRRAVRDRLQAVGNIVVAADARDGVEAVELACHYRPDILLMETALPRVDGITAMRQVLDRAPEVRVVIFSVSNDDDTEMRALRAGASGYLSKQTDLAGVARALQAVARGEAAVSRRAAMRLVESVRAAPGPRGMRPVRSNLSSREWEVLDLLIAGASTHEAAEALYLTPDTVRSHRKSIRRKLGVRSHAEIVAAGRRLQHSAAAA